MNQKIATGAGTLIIIIIAITVVIFVWLYEKDRPIDSEQIIQNYTNKKSIVGGDRDEHGCIGSAGYSWCEEKQKCLRSWEENCGNSNLPICKDLCGDGECDENVCMAAGCPCAETKESCPQDCSSGDILIADWKIYKDEKYSYQFQYPSGWNLIGDNGSDPDGYNVTIWKGDGADEDNIQIVKVIYGANADGTVSNRESRLKMLANSGDTRVSIAGGQGYYSVKETKGGLSPMIYLVGDNEIFLMNYNIFYSKKTSLADAEKLFKQIIGTFKFTK